MLEKLIKKVNKKDVAILRTLDGLRGSFEFVLLSKLKEKLPYKEELIKACLKKLNKFKLIQVKRMENEIGAKILEKGLDILALWNFLTHEKISSLLVQIGKGKESILYSAIDAEKNWLVVKLHRYYTQEFKKIEKSLAYAAVKLRGIELRIADYMIDIPKAKAQVEYYALKKLYENGINVPRPIDLDRHAVLMEMLYDVPGIPSKLLKEVLLKNPNNALEIILEDYHVIIKKLGLIHGDLSEFNIMVSKNDLYYIDWPQAVPTSYKFANELIKRDLNNILRFFREKYSIEKEINMADYLV